MRITLKSVKQSRIPELLGICAEDTYRLAAMVNDAQERLIYAGKEAGWWEGWVKTRFSVTAAAPYITLPREFARIINMALCSQPIYIHNEFYEVLPGGPGPMPDVSCCSDWCGSVAGYERGVWPTKVDLTATNQRLRVYTTDDRDLGMKMLFVGLDQNGNTIYDMDGLRNVTGFYITFMSPFNDSAFDVSKITAVVKPVTFGDVLVYQVDQTTGVEVLLSRYLASETNPAYRRYYIAPFCSSCSAGVTVNAIAKLEYIPAIRDTDPLIIGNIPALEEMCQALRGYSQEVTAAHAMAERHEKRAIKLLKQQMDHYLGIENPAVTVDSMQQASLSRIGLSTNI
jgi:hypothetical protein